MQRLEQSVIRILNAHDKTVGTGFVVTDRLAVTCAHVIKAAGSIYDQPIRIQFYWGEIEQVAQVLSVGWSSATTDDVALLQLDHLPEGIVPVVLGSARQCEGHPYCAFGFASLAGYDSRKVTDTLDGIVSVRDKHKRPMLQLKGEEIDQGLSGAPIVDTQTNRVVGMVSEYKDNERTRFAWATTADTLITYYPALQIWPEAYGPDELHAYLDYLIKDNQTLPIPILSRGDKVPLERVYVSLRADEMNIAEREAERDLYLEDVFELQGVIGGDISDPYSRFTELHQAIVRFPQMRMLIARNRLRLFAEREAGSLSLAEVVRQHQYAVLLGNPGSGKTTLGKWLVLQFARAFLEGEANVRVRADLVRPDAETEEFIDLGPARLPILIQIADYARARWNEGEVDTKLPLEDFLGQQYNGRKDKPIALTPEAMHALTHAYLKWGRALIVLDGLDEVSNPQQRREVMHAIKEFIQAQLRVAVEGEEVGNRVLLTSRIVGYQFDPLTELPHYTIENMDGEAIAAFCRNWTNQATKTDEVGTLELAEHLLDVIFNQSHPSVRTLAENPLLLTILVQMQRMDSQQELPTRRVELFSRAAEALYDQRKSFWRQVGISPENLTRGLSAVAAYIQANEATGFAEEDTVRAQLDATFKDRRQTEAVLDAAREVGGVLVAHSEGVYGFLHRSLQEYFAAKFLTEKPDHVAEQIALRLLNPTWHEPIVLAMGIVSQAGYSANRRRLSEAFICILNAPDPVGDILPRRELLAIEACTECKRIPPEVGRQIAEKLLDLYAGHRGPISLRILQHHILHAFAVLHNGDAAVEVETVLCDALGARDTRRRLAAVDLILRAQWDSQVIVRALVVAWCAYPDPAASLLTALDGVRDRQPALFQPDFLPMRQALMDEQLLWERISTDQEWAALIRTLYMSPNSDCAPEQITRDSPLTPQVLAALRQAPETHPLVALRQHLLSLAKHSGTVSARDAALD